MRRTKEEAEETKRSILEAARTLFVQKGFGPTTLDDIASAAGFTRGAVHWHFQNKLGLLAALRDMERSPMQRLIDKLAIDDELDPIDALGATMENFFQELAANPDKRQLFQVMYREMHNRMFDPNFDRIQRFDAEVRRMITNILRLAEQRGTLSTLWTPESAAFAMQTMVKGMITGWLYETTSFDLSDEGLSAVKSFLSSLRRNTSVN